MSINTNKTAIAIYSRVSTLDQGTEMQRSDLLRYAKARGWKIFNIYEEKISATHSKRPQFQQLLKDARQRKFDVCLVWKLDRAFRSLKDCLNHLQELADLGIEFVSLKDNGIDMTIPSGKLLLHILAAFAEFEASMIRMRVRAGIENARKKKKTWGRPPSLNKLEVARLRAQGLSLSQIAKQLGSTKSTVSKTLKKHESQSTEITTSQFQNFAVAKTKLIETPNSDR